MELIQLSGFNQIVKTGSFSEASKKTFRSQSAISHQIKNLETEFGIKLFERVGNKVKLTQDGEFFYEKTNKILVDLEELRRIFTKSDYGESGRLAIAATKSVVSFVFPDIIENFVARFPNVRFKVLACGFISELLPLVLDGEVDFGVGIKSQQEYSPRLNFLFWKAFDMCLIVSKEHALSRIRRIRLVDIAKYPHILYGRRTVSRQLIDEVYYSHNLKPEIIMEVDMAKNVKHYVGKGLGVGIISSLSITKQDRERLFVFNSKDLFGQVQFGIYYRKGSYISLAMNQFVKLFAGKLIYR